MDCNKAFKNTKEILFIEERIRKSNLNDVDISYLEKLNSSEDVFPRSLFIHGFLYLKGIKVIKSKRIAYEYFSRAKEKGAGFIQMAIVEALVNYDESPDTDFILDCIKKAKADKYPGSRMLYFKLKILNSIKNLL